MSGAVGVEIGGFGSANRWKEWAGEWARLRWSRRGRRARRHAHRAAAHSREGGVHRALTTGAGGSRRARRDRGVGTRRPEARADGGRVQRRSPRVRRRRRLRRDLVRARGSTLGIVVVDDGAGFDPERPPALQGEEPTEGGLGISIIRTIADDVSSTPGRFARVAPPLREAPPQPSSPLSDQTTQRRKILVVANRGPVAYGRAPDGSRTARRGSGGLVTALGGLLAHHDVTWVASAMGAEDAIVAAEQGARFRRRRATARPIGTARRAPRPTSTTASTTSSRIRRSGSCSTTSGGSAPRPTSARHCTTPGIAVTSR